MKLASHRAAANTPATPRVRLASWRANLQVHLPDSANANSLPLSMSMAKVSEVLSVIAVLSATATASAQEYTRRSFLVPEGHVELTGEPSRPQMLRIDVSKDGSHPIFVAPHVYWGVSRDLTIGITHREGICLKGCGGRVYQDAGFGLLYNLVRERNFELDLNTGAQVRNFDPFHFGVKGGVIGRVNFSSVAFVFDPTLYIGLTRRDTGNREQLVLPVWFYFQATRVVVPFVGAMVVGPLDGFGDSYSVPVEGGSVFSVSENVDLGAYFRFSNLLGRGSSTDWREIGMLGRFRF
jgi:hypothetical protein